MEELLAEQMAIIDQLQERIAALESEIETLDTALAEKVEALKEITEEFETAKEDHKTDAEEIKDLQAAADEVTSLVEDMLSEIHGCARPVSTQTIPWVSVRNLADHVFGA